MILYIDMDDVLCDFSGGKKAAQEIFPEIVYPHSQYGFYKNLKPIEHAQSAVKKLMQSISCEVYILTAPSIYNPFSYTEKRLWVEEYLGFHMLKRLIISPDKGLLRGDILIDDQLQGHGQRGFQGQLLNFGSQEYPDWQSVLRKLESLTGEKFGGID